METQSTALYRRYRPDTFADVIGQEHVTEPLVAAIDSGRISHAYLFSGPRGCGKTTSARIFARCLNCAQGPTGSPCGQCASCSDLARGGPGSLDVVEMDAASHGGVDDARDLRERAIFAPARDRYKIFIIDEAHMVTTQGFNALLKLVEEPPEHVKFVFATTEPEKVIGTIRSRTHHYPFRLVPPERLASYLGELSASENVQIDDGVIPLVVRAGAGSVRDSLSVLDQLMAGSVDGVVTYQRAVALLGYTPEGLLDDAVSALAAQDGAGLFGVVEQVISSGHDPRRFTEDLLERFRDLIVVLAAGENAKSVLPEVPDDQLRRMRTQAGHLGAATCSRAADLAQEALEQMTGATSPRLQLELLCARLLLPTADEGVRALAMRLERVEAAGTGVGAGAGAGAGVAGPGTGAPAPAPQPPVGSGPPVRSQQPPVPRGQPQSEPEPEPAPEVEAEHEPPARPAAAAAWQAAAKAQKTDAEDAWPSINLPGHQSGAHGTPEPRTPEEGEAEPVRAEGSEPERPAASAPHPGPAQGPQDGHEPARQVDGSQGGGLTVQQLRNRWPEVLQTLARLKRSTWALVAQDAQVVDLQPEVLTVGFSTAGLATAFQRGNHAESLGQAITDSIGMNLRIETTIVGAGGRGPAASSPPAAPAPAAAPGPQAPPAPQTGPPPTAPRTPSPQPPSPAPEDPEPPSNQGPSVAPPTGAGTQAGPPRAAGPDGSAPGRTAGGQGRPPSSHPSAGGLPPEGDNPPAAPPEDYDDYSPDDADLGHSDLVGPPLVAKMLGGTVIDEFVEE